MHAVDSCTYYILTHLLYVSYVTQILCLLRYFSLLYPVASPILIVVEKTYAHAFHTNDNSKITTNKDCKREFLNLSATTHNF